MSSRQLDLSGSFVRIFILCGFLSSFDIYAQTVPFDPVTMDEVAIDKNYPPEFHEVFIPQSEVSLTGFVLTANGREAHPTAVLLHGLPGNEKNLDLAQSMRRAGFNVLFFHYQGAWGSQGNYSFSTMHSDVLVALRFLRENAAKFRVDVERLSIVGHSFGGYAALRTGTVDSNLECVIALSAANPAVIAQSQRINPHAKNNIGNYIDNLIMLNNFSGKQAIKELANYSGDMDIRQYGQQLIDKKVLLVVGEQDNVTPSALQKEVVAHYKKVKGLDFESFIIPGDHAFSISRIQMQRLVVNWMMTRCR